MKLPGLRLLLGLILCATAGADIRVPALFSDHMVVQRAQPIPVWGWATPDSTITVRLGDAEARTTVSADGRWRCDLEALTAGGPHRLTISGDGATIVEDVLVGEVWIGSGQSNMQWAVLDSDNPDEETAAADHPQIRLFYVPRTTAPTPQDDVDAAWQVCSPETVPGFSAVSYYFGRRLQQELGVPVGLIHSSWGGTRIEPWTDLAALRQLAPRLPEDQRQALETAMEKVESPPTAAKRQAWQASVAALEAAEADTSSALAAPDVDDSGWATMDVPGKWEESELGPFDGMVWFRRTVDIPSGWAGRDLELRLGPIDEVDITWFDGVHVGSMGNWSRGHIMVWDDPRVYTVAGTLVQPGPRTITVRAIDGFGWGGLWGSPAKEMYLAPVDAAEGERITLAGAWRYKTGPGLAEAPPAAKQQPANLYHAMIHPLIPYGIRGAIWYQGESNLWDGAAYAEKMEALIASWRGLWQQPVPFYFAQLAPFRYGSPERLPILWEAQSDVLDRVDDTGMAVITDVGNLDDIHPRDKQTVGARLAGWALARTYGKAIPYSGPRYLGMDVEGSSIRLRFEFARGLKSVDGEALSWFEIAGADGVYEPAQATIEGTSIVVSAAAVDAPTAVRFGWHEEAEPTS